MMINRGIAAILTDKPINMSTLQTISNDTTNDARNSGLQIRFFQIVLLLPIQEKVTFGFLSKEISIQQSPVVKQTCNRLLF